MVHTVRLAGGWLAAVSVIGLLGCGAEGDWEQPPPVAPSSGQEETPTGSGQKETVTGSGPEVAPTSLPSPGCDVLQGGAVNSGALPAQCVKLEGGQIGQQGLQRSVSGIAVSFTSWTAKHGAAGEFVGFAYAASEPVCVSVKAGTASFVADQPGSWTHPAGTSGPLAYAISSLVICHPDEVEPLVGEGGAGCSCLARTCGPDPVCGTSCGTCPSGQGCTPQGTCSIVYPH